jgi:hypothetical protein
MRQIDALHEPLFTIKELAESRKLHPDTVRKLFRDEPGVIRFRRVDKRNNNRSNSETTVPPNRECFCYRIPESVARRVFQRMMVPTEGRHE